MWARPSDYKLVGICLGDARRTAGITQEELARRLRKPRSFISSYERGQRRVDIVEFLLIAEAIKIDARKLFEGILTSEGALDDLTHFPAELADIACGCSAMRRREAAHLLREPTRVTLVDDPSPLHPPAHQDLVARGPRAGG